jgi:ATP-binding cassette subfamily B protein
LVIRGWRVSVRHRIVHLRRSVRLVLRVTPRLTAAWALALIVQGLVPVALVYLTKLLVDRLTAVVGTAAVWSAVLPVITIAATMAALVIATELLQVGIGWLRTVQAEVVQDHIRGLVHEKSVSLDLAYYESSEYHDRLHRARHEAAHRPLALLEGAGALLQGSVTLAGMASLVFPYGAWVPVALVAAATPHAVAVVRNSRRHHQWWRTTTADRRWTNYYDWLLTFSEFAAEVRQAGVGSHFASTYQRLRHRLREQRLDLLRRENVTRVGASLAAMLIAGGTIGWMVWRTLAGLATLGDLVLFHQAFERGRSALRGWMGSAGQLYSDSLIVESLFEFLDQAPAVVDPPSPRRLPPAVAEGIAFDEVRFRYDASQPAVLNGFSMALSPGEIAALVGPNGAGKSTVLKLLCRLYDPESGRITLDGVDVRSFRVSELRQAMTVAFQVPIPYHATLHENIAVGDLRTNPAGADVAQAAAAGGADGLAARLPRGYETLLSKWFADGTQLSTGEWQRVALARALVRPAPIVVLDEPTSAMDPWSEAMWLERLRAVARGRTVLLITHRLSTALAADVIHVMQAGRIVRSVRPALEPDATEILTLDPALISAAEPDDRGLHHAPLVPQR